MILEPGTEIGDYVVERQIGRGAYSDVFLVKNKAGINHVLKVNIEHDEAKKRHPGSNVYQGSKKPPNERTEDEARILRKLSHPGIIKLNDLITLPDGTKGILTEQVSNPQTLEQCIKNLSLQERIAISMEIASATHYLQEAEVIHRDLRPANILVYGADFNLADRRISVCAVPRAKIIDFGLATLCNEQCEDKGSVLYGPPEARNIRYNTNSDLWSLALTLYEIMTGEKFMSSQVCIKSTVALELYEAITKSKLTLEKQDRETLETHISSLLTSTKKFKKWKHEKMKEFRRWTFANTQGSLWIHSFFTNYNDQGVQRARITDIPTPKLSLIYLYLAVTENLRISPQQRYLPMFEQFNAAALTSWRETDQLRNPFIKEPARSEYQVLEQSRAWTQLWRNLRKRY